MPDERPSLLRILQADLASLLALIFLVVYWGFYLLDALVLNNQMAALPAPLLAGTLAGVGILIWRLNFVLELFQRGSEAAAVVEDVGVWRTHLTVHLMYTVRGQRYFHALSMLPTQRTLAITRCDELIVLYDPDNPRRILIKDLYL